MYEKVGKRFRPYLASFRTNTLIRHQSRSNCGDHHADKSSIDVGGTRTSILFSIIENYMEKFCGKLYGFVLFYGKKSMCFSK